MSKTYLEHLDKAKALAAGLRKNHEAIKNYGISLEELAVQEEAVREGEKLNAQVERLRAETNAAVDEANRKLVEIKDRTATWKRIVKRNVDVTRWPDYGVMDKR